VIYQMHDIRFFDPLKPPSNPPSVYLHEACTPPFFARSNRQARQAEPPSGSVPAAAMAKPAEEGTTVSVPFMITLAQKAQLRARGFSDEQIANLNAQQAHDILGQAEASAPKPAATQQSEPAKPADMPPPSDPVEHLRASGARLDASREPCAGYRPGDWRRVHRVIAAFLAGPFAKLAVDVGWTELELVGVHPEVGVARPDACGALLTNAYGSPVTQVTPQLIRFANGLAVYKARLSVGNSVAVWDYWESAVGERQQLARTPISESVTDSAEGEPGLEQPCAARRGRVQEKDGVFLHFCVECGRFGPYGYGVRLRAGQLGRWYCREHRPQAHEP
jgi:hypothetical protein